MLRVEPLSFGFHLPSTQSAFLRSQWLAVTPLPYHCYKCFARAIASLATTDPQSILVVLLAASCTICVCRVKAKRNAQNHFDVVLSNFLLLSVSLSKGLHHSIMSSKSFVAKTSYRRSNSHLATRPTPGQASDPALLKLTNHYVRQHRFVATSLTTFTTSERRGFERDVHDYARGVGLSKNQAKKEVIKARSFCGEIDYDSDVSALDGEINDQIQIIQKLVLPSSAPSEAKEHIRIRDAETPIPGEAPIEAVIAQTESYRIKLQSNRQTQVKKHEERKREGHVPVPQSKENLGGAGRVYAAMPHQGFTSGFGSLDQNEGPSEDRQFGNGKRTKKPNETTAVLGDQGVITGEYKLEDGASAEKLGRLLQKAASACRAISKRHKRKGAE